MKIQKYILILLLLFGWLVAPIKAETIKVYTYHVHPPFITGVNEGYSYSLVRVLNRHSGAKYNFELEPMPRKTLDEKIKTPDSWIVIWGNPIWFGDKEEKKYLWVDILKDANMIISRSDNQVRYNGPPSLVGYKFGGVSGHRYVGIDSLVEEGMINRIDGSNEINNVNDLLEGKLDVILLPRSTIIHFIRKLRLFGKLYLAAEAHQIFVRKFMIPIGSDELKSFLARVSFENREKWRAFKIE